MKKVLFVATVVKTHIMPFHLPYLQWFSENGYETHVCAKNDYQKKGDCMIPFCDQFYDLAFERSPFSLKNIYAFRTLKELIRENEYEIIHCHTPVGGVLTRLAARVAKGNRAKVIYTAHGFHFYKGAPLLNWMMYFPIEKLLARHTDVLITINHEDYARTRNFRAKKKVYVPGVGIDIRRFQKEYIDRNKKRVEFALEQDDFVLLSIGELTKRKNHHVVLKTIAKLANSRLRYLICGQGALLDELKQLAAQLGIEKQVRFLGHRSDIADICAMSDVFMFPSLQEGLPVALMEAMASGLPVICSNIRGNMDLIEHGEGGYLVEANDVNGYAKALETLINAPEFGAKMRKINTETIQKCDIRCVMNQMQEVYKGVISSV